MLTSWFSLLQGTRETASSVHVRGKNIRYVHIPPDLDISKAINDMVRIVSFFPFVLFVAQLRFFGLIFQKKRFEKGKNAYKRKMKKPVGQPSRTGLQVQQTPADGRPASE